MKKSVKKQNKIFRFCKQSASRARSGTSIAKQLNVAHRRQPTKGLVEV